MTASETKSLPGDQQASATDSPGIPLPPAIADLEKTDPSLYKCLSNGICAAIIDIGEGLRGNIPGT